MSTSAAIDRAQLTEVAELAAALRAEVGARYFGHPAVVDLLLTTLLARGHLLLEGVPGIAKTTLCKAFAAALGCSFRRIQFTPDLLPADITGTYVLDGRSGEFVLREGPIFAQVVLADEINRAPAKTQSALLEAMQERQVTIEGQTRALELPFVVLATQNPIEHEGTYPLPEAQVDRFLGRLRLGYPERALEKSMLQRYAGRQPRETQAGPVLDPPSILRAQELVESVHVEDELLDYVIALAEHTRAHRRLALGASPRACLQLVAACKARALLGGRGFVLPDDVKQLVPFVFGHRLLLTADAELEGVLAETVVREALDQVPYRAAAPGR